MIRPTKKSSGVTPSEDYLAHLCERSFLNLWSYPNLFKQQGKELCDLLVVCGTDVLIFSDKHISFPNTDDVRTNFRHWFRKAIVESVKQIYGAERWIQTQQDRLFLDAACKDRLPIAMPNPSVRKIYRIAIANGATNGCRKYFGGGSGSLIIMPDLSASFILDKKCTDWPPFSIGDAYPDKGFVHILDEVALDILMQELDTLPDFVEYLAKKEAFFKSGLLALAYGEEELLACYLNNYCPNSGHYFVPQAAIDDLKERQIFIQIPEGSWNALNTSPQYERMKQANAKSFIWDNLIKILSKNLIGATCLPSGKSAVTADVEEALRHMALESRFRRRVLSQAIDDAINSYQENQRSFRSIVPHPSLRKGGTAYVFLQFPFLHSSTVNTYDQYRLARRNLLSAYSEGVKADDPELGRVIGIALEPERIHYPMRSQDVIVFSPSSWSEDDTIRSKLTREKLGIMREAEIRRSEIRQDAWPGADS